MDRPDSTVRIYRTVDWVAKCRCCLTWTSMNWGCTKCARCVCALDILEKSNFRQYSIFSNFCLYLALSKYLCLPWDISFPARFHFNSCNPAIMSFATAVAIAWLLVTCKNLSEQDHRKNLQVCINLGTLWPEQTAHICSLIMAFVVCHHNNILSCHQERFWLDIFWHHVE